MRPTLGRILLALVLVPTAIVGCDDEATVVIEAIDCPRESITFDVDVRKGEVQSRDWLISVDATVLCDGEPVDGAQIKVRWWWGEIGIGETDENGQVTVEDFTAENDPRGEEIDVTVSGSDGELTTTETVP